NQGLELTLKLMFEAEKIALKDRDFVKWVANNFKYFGTVEGKSFCVWNYVIHNFKFKQDDFDETIINPRLMPIIKKGDCDDFALFIKTVLKILGINSYYILFGKKINEFSHVAVFVNKNLIIDGTNKEFNK